MSSKQHRGGNEKVGAFVLNNDARYSWMVYAHVPTADGKRIKTKFKAEFQHIPREERIQLLRDWKDQVANQAKPIDSEDAADVAIQALGYEGAILDRVLIGFSGVVDASGDEVKFNDETKALLLKNEWARDATMRAYINSLSTRDDTGN